MPYNVGVRRPSLALADLRAIAECLPTLWAVLATPHHPGHYVGCTATTPGTACLRPCRDVRFARERLPRLIDEEIERLVTRQDRA